MQCLLPLVIQLKTTSNVFYLVRSGCCTGQAEGTPLMRFISCCMSFLSSLISASRAGRSRSNALQSFSARQHVKKSLRFCRHSGFRTFTLSLTAFASAIRFSRSSEYSERRSRSVSAQNQI